ncbi:MAG: hypothetical protein P0S94_04835, partial [Simkaniaceae bacterium]|nr:hypothetical protein [Simkaniaceae bacterium]
SGTAALQTEATRLNIDNDEELVPVIARYCAIEDEVIVAQTKKEDLEKLDFDNDAARALNAFEIYRIEESDDLDLKRTGILKGNLEKAFLLHILKNKNDQRMMNAFGQAHILPRYVRDGVKNQTFFQLTNDALVERSEFMDGSVDKITELAAKIFSSPVDGTDDGTGTGDS